LPRLYNTPIWLNADYDCRCGLLLGLLEQEFPFVPPPEASLELLARSGYREDAWSAEWLATVRSNDELFEAWNWSPLLFVSDPALVRTIFPCLLMGSLTLYNDHPSPSESGLPESICSALVPTRSRSLEEWSERFSLLSPLQMSLFRTALELLSERPDLDLQPTKALQGFWDQFPAVSFVPK
jgi:hypothetical protein